jgi:GMP synthase (glutamine-hydrolysing)
VKVLVIESQRMVPIGSFARPLRAAGLELVYWRTPEEPPPDSLADVAGIVALGGSANPDETDRYPWLAQERELLAGAVGRGLPTVGLCLGGELLAEVLGSSPVRLPQPEIGWHPLELEAAARDDTLLQLLPERIDVFHWHSFGFALPSGARLLAGTADQAQAFSFGGFAWGFQFHLEADEAIIGDWVNHYAKLLREQYIDPERTLEATYERAPAYRLYATRAARAFANVVRTGVQERTSAT